jgi:hypothetical protein
MSKGQPQNNSRKASAATPKSAARKLSAWPIAASLSIIAVGIYRAIDLRWICDDAFITMRYVKNFVEGNGLVYNIGERVEGYTHFFWLMLLAASKAIGFDPVDSSIWLGIVSYAGILAFLLAMSFREQRKNPKTLWLPLAAALFALNYDTAEWASGGLETSFFTLLILAAFYLWFYSGWTEHRRLLLTGVALALVSLTRPDGVLFTLTAVLLLSVSGIRRKQSLLSVSKSAGILILPSVALGLPYLLWKYFYYGDLLPLTYYAKSGEDNYFGQGFFYIWLYFRVHFISAIALIAGLLLSLKKKQNDGAASNDSYTGSPSVAALTGILVYLILFVARSGGDFMFARFIVPVIPFVCFVIERAFERLRSNAGRRRIVMALILLSAFFVEGKLPTAGIFHLGDDGRRVEDWENIVNGSTKFIADERWYYYDRFEVPSLQRGTMDIDTEVGKYLEPFFAGLPVTVAIPGAMNMEAYYANFSTAINEYGLTDAYIAHSNVSSPGHIGHEKKAPPEYLLRRNVNFELGDLVAELPDHLGVHEIAFEIPSLGLWQLADLVTYDKTIMNQLAERFSAAGNQTHIPLYEDILPDYVEHTMPNRSLSQLEAAYGRYRHIYFDKYPDSALQRRFEERIAELKRDSIR